MRDSKAKAPDTAYGVLGMLTFGEMSGYDLSKAIEGSIGFFWAPAKSQLYAELRRLVELGWAREREVEQTDRPDKRIYTITPAGEEALRSWLSTPPVEIDPIKSPFLLRLFFGHLAGADAVRGLVTEHRRQAEELLETFGQIETHLLEQAGPLPPYLTLTYGMSYARSVVDWCDRALEDLDEGMTVPRVKEGAR
ncbi:MAG TPA: PadR family transcriptional regulator [Actinomycetota bacterium]|nr:PadR family transcriptional regulator [Actinomycetota bacterium]